jgi:tetratricopeptide (TPR) repeat protein
MPCPVSLRVAACGCAGWLALAGAVAAAERSAARAPAVPGRFELAFADGVWAFHLGQDLEAEERFREALAIREHPLVRYWLGLAYLQQGRGKEALAALEEGLAAWGDATRVTTRSRLSHLGAAQLAVGRAEIAADMLAQALAAGAKDAATLYRCAEALALMGRVGEAEEARARARQLAPDLDPDLASLPVSPPELEGVPGSGGAPSRWSTRAAVTAGADSNPHLLDDELAVLTPTGEVVRGAQRDAVAALALDAGYRVPLGNGDWRAGAMLSAGRSLHRDFGELDVGNLGVELRLESGGEDSGGGSGNGTGGGRVAGLGGLRRPHLAFAAGWQDFEVDGEGYLRALDTSLAATWRLDPAVAARLELRLLDRGYGGHPFADERRSGEEGSVTLAGLFGPSDGKRQLAARVTGGRRRAGLAFAHDFAEVGLAASAQLAPRWRADADLAWRDERYDDPASDLFVVSGRERRRDNTLRAGVTLAYSVASGLWVTAESRWTERNSNVEDSSGLVDLGYRRWTVALGITWER